MQPVAQGLHKRPVKYVLPVHWGTQVPIVVFWYPAIQFVQEAALVVEQPLHYGLHGRQLDPDIIVTRGHDATQEPLDKN